MATEVNLKPGWLSRDTRRAANRVHEWSAPKPAAMPRSERQDPSQSEVQSSGMPEGSSDNDRS